MDSALDNFKRHVLSLVSMDEETFNLCLPYIELKTLEKNEFFIEYGRKANRLGYINSGLLRIFHLKDGIEVTSCFCSEGSFTTDIESFIEGTTAQNNIQAIEHSTIISISKEKLDILYSKSPAWQSAGMSIISKECARLSGRVSSLSFDTAKEKYRSILTHEPELIQRVPVQYIASYIGVSRETLSRIRQQVAQE